MYHEVYTPERTHSGIVPFLQVYTRTVGEGRAQSEPSTSKLSLSVCKNALSVSPSPPKRGLGGTGKVLASFLKWTFLENKSCLSPGRESLFHNSAMWWGKTWICTQKKMEKNYRECWMQQVLRVSLSLGHRWVLGLMFHRQNRPANTWTSRWEGGVVTSWCCRRLCIRTCWAAETSPQLAVQYVSRNIGSWKERSIQQCGCMFHALQV